MTIIEVKTSAHIKTFHQIPFEIYKNDSNWIPHIKQDVEKVFTKKENKFFRHGERRLHFRVVSVSLFCNA